jgi:hypothetical protein
MIELINIVDYLKETGQDCDSDADTYTFAELIFDELVNGDPSSDELDKIINVIHADYRLR